MACGLYANSEVRNCSKFSPQTNFCNENRTANGEPIFARDMVMQTIFEFDMCGEAVSSTKLHEIQELSCLCMFCKEAHQNSDVTKAIGGTLFHLKWENSQSAKPMRVLLGRYVYLPDGGEFDLSGLVAKGCYVESCQQADKFCSQKEMSFIPTSQMAQPDVNAVMGWMHSLHM